MERPGLRFSITPATTATRPPPTRAAARGARSLVGQSLPPSAQLEQPAPQDQQVQQEQPDRPVPPGQQGRPEQPVRQALQVPPVRLEQPVLLEPRVPLERREPPVIREPLAPPDRLVQPELPELPERQVPPGPRVPRG